MCNVVDIDTLENGIGHYLKGNEPEPIAMKIIVGPCICGKLWWARVPGGVVWVEAEKQEVREVDDRTGRKFQDEIRKAMTPAEISDAIRSGS